MPDFNDIYLTGVPQVHNCEPTWSWSPSPLVDCDLWVVLDGDGRLVLDGVHHQLDAGAAFLFAPGAQVRGDHNPEDCLRVFAVHLDMPAAPSHSIFRRAFDVTYLGMLGRHCATAYRSGNILEATVLVRAILLHIFGSPNSVSRPGDLSIQRLMDEIDEGPGHSWSLAEMSAVVHLSRQQLTRRFTAVAGLAPMQYVINARIERAKSLLTNTSLSVSQIADALGYTEIYYFSRQFRKEAGVSPSEYRKGR